jgi:CheY-like chemotaxis protein
MAIMAGAPILVVDDSSVNLKLMRLLLTFEGFDVRTSARAEEALQMLDSFRPQLVLTDIRMPGMDGLEMTRRIKGDRRNSGIKVAALTASTSALDNQRAMEAGCEGYITKPVDTATLALRVRELLGERAAERPATEAATPTPRLPPPEVCSWRRRFLREGSGRSREFLETMDTRLDSVRMSGQLHDWAGSGGTLGFAGITKLARQGEELLAESPLRAMALRECISDLYITFDELLKSEEVPEPDFVRQALEGKRVALVGLPAEYADAICAALGRVKARPLLFSFSDHLESQSIRECDFTILHAQAGMDAGRLNAAGACSGAGKLLLAGDRADLMSLAPVMHSAAEYLAGTWEPEEVLMRLALAASRASTAAAPPPTGSAGGPKVRAAHWSGVPERIAGRRRSHHSGADAIHPGELRHALPDGGQRPRCAAHRPRKQAARCRTGREHAAIRRF